MNCLYFRLIRRTGWRRFLGAAALLASFALWFAAGDSPLTRAQEAAGRLPELTPGFHRGEPAATLLRLGAARGDYLWMQAFDAVFVALMAMTSLFALALAAKKPAPMPALQLLMLVPAAYVAAELGENLLLTLFASGALAPSPWLAGVQQTGTTLKLALAAGTLALSFSFLRALSGARPSVRAPL